MQIYLTIPHMLTSKLNAMVQYNDELKLVITNVSKDKYRKNTRLTLCCIPTSFGIISLSFGYNETLHTMGKYITRHHNVLIT